MPGVVDVLRAAYDLDGETDTWLSRLTEAARPHLDEGLGVVAWLFGWKNDAFGITGFASAGAADGMMDMPLKLADMGSSTLVERTLRSAGLSVATTSERAPAAEFDLIMQRCAPGLGDFIAVQSLDYLGHGILLGIPLPAARRLQASERQLKERLAAHLNAAFRLRAALQGSAVLASDSERAEAVLESGRTVHATGEARSESAQQVLQRAAIAIDATRAERRDSAALEAWQGLVDGRWSLVEQFERDGRRYLVALKNPVHSPDPRSLTLREKQVVALIGDRMSSKLAAYACGVSPATLATHLGSALKKLGLNSKAELVQWLAELRTKQGT